MTGPTSTQKGREGEELAVRVLSERGYVIVERNYRARRGEIDIIAEEGGDLVFVEVRCFQDQSVVSPLESVSELKKKRLMAAARHYIARSTSEPNIRFDVVTITLHAPQPPEITLIRDIFPSL